MYQSIGPVRSFVGVLGLITFLSGCGGGGGDVAPTGSEQPRSTGATTIEGQVVKGPVSKAIVKVFALSADGTPATEPLTQGVSDDQGMFSLAYTDPAVSHIIVVASGGSYVDELTGSRISVAETDSLEAVSLVQSSGAHSVNVTPLTSLAAAKAKWVKANTEKTITDAVIFGNLQVSAFFGIENVLTTVIPGLDTLNAATQEQQTYGLLLAGFSQLDADASDRTAMQLVAAMAQDFGADGQIGNDSNAPTLEGLVAAVDKFIGTRGDVIQARLPAAVRDRLNSSPVAGADALDTVEETPVTFFPLVNDRDPNGEKIELFSADAISAKGGSIGRNPDGSLTYTPAKDFFGSDHFSYTIIDASLNGGVGTVAIDVRNVNDAPVAGSPVYDTVEGVDLVNVLLATDPDGDQLTFSFSGQGQLGAITLLNARSGQFSYKATANVAGVDEIPYSVSDGVLSAAGTLRVNVQNIADAPVAVSASFALDEDTILIGQLTGRDDEGDNLEYSLVGGASKGTVSLTDVASGAFAYVPAPDAFGQDAFTFKVRDIGATEPKDSNVATVVITINSINDAPVVRADSLGSVAEDDVFAFPAANLLVNDNDVDGDSLKVAAVTVSQGLGNVALSGGTVTFVPTPNFFGPVAFDYSVSDGGATVVGTATLQVTPVEDDPVIVSAPSLSVSQGVAYAYPVIATDGDPADVLIYSLPVAPAGMSIDSMTGVVAWTPSSGDVGNHSVTVAVADPQNNQASQTFQLVVVNVNDAPVITSAPPTVKLFAGVRFTHQVVAFDSDAGDTLRYSLDAYPSGMSIDPSSGVLSWTPGSSVYGLRRVIVRATDSAGGFVVQEFDVSVVIPRDQWNVTFVDSEESGREVSYMLDGNISTIWHSEWSQQQSPVPHQFEIDLGAIYEIYGFLYQPRQDCCNGRISHYEFSVSMDGLAWQQIGVGKIDSKSAAAFAGWVNPPLLFQRARYIRFVALREDSNQSFTAVAEFDVFGTVSTDTSATNTITAPSNHVVTINAGDTVTFSGEATDPDVGGVPVTTWTFGGAGIADVAGLSPGAVQFNVPGTYAVTFAATGSLLPDTRIVRVLDGLETLVPKSDWAVVNVSGEEYVTYVDKNSGATQIVIDRAAEYAFDDDARTLWHTRWFYIASEGFPHSVEIDLAASYRLTGIRHLPRQDGGPRSIKNFKVEVSMDGSSWTAAIADGLLPNTSGETKVMFDNDATLDARYIRFTAVTPQRTNFFASIAELNLVGEALGPIEP